MNGKFFWFHLVDQDTGENFSACVYQPLAGGVDQLDVAIVESGHGQPRNPNNWLSKICLDLLKSSINIYLIA